MGGSRRRERLEELKESYPNICPVCADLLTVSGRDLLRKKLETEQPGVRLLVLGAGCGHYGLLETQKEEALAEMIALNDEALTRVLAMALPHIPEKSRILAIASSAAASRPGFAVYAASHIRPPSLSGTGTRAEKAQSNGDGGVSGTGQNRVF